MPKTMLRANKDNELEVSNVSARDHQLAKQVLPIEQIVLGPVFEKF